jgi:peptidoglycan hydrolase-like protein with peptidoglycan-binding domain
MALQCARFSSEPDIVRASTNSPPLRQGSPHADGVRVLQLALIDLGFAMPISTKNGASLPDGVFGAETLKTVMAFQRANGLVADGVVGAHTMERLDKVIAAQSAAQARADALGGDKSKGLS